MGFSRNRTISSSSHTSNRSTASPTKKRKITHTASTAGECQWCHTKKTAQWRKGPTGARGLCNACGLEWAKQIKIEAKRLNISNAEAESNLIANYENNRERQASSSSAEE
ncbi:hypothetical protein EDD86DRAFT_243622 [Gorgonomyces haynaldii]|nr:hypothetical protein EDD86DRAFT_243622 [Gorgonomyces haynaldii]